MKILYSIDIKIILRISFFLLFLTSFFTKVDIYAQTEKSNKSVQQQYLKGTDNDIYGTSKRFIENVGQYGSIYDKYPEMGRILYAYEGFMVPVLFTEKGLIYLHRKIEGPKLSEQEREERKKKKKKKEEEIEELEVKDRAITAQWLNTNSNIEIIAEDKTEEYHTYGFLQEQARAYKKITYKNLYPGIDLVYTFLSNNKIGFEYSLMVQPGTDISIVKILYGGEIKKIKQDAEGNLLIKSDAGTTIETIPVSYYGDKIPEAKDSLQKIKSAFVIKGKELSFSMPESYDKTKAIVIDPFVTATGNLIGTGVNAGIAKDVDYDYAGNVYVTGGGNGSVYKLAKFDANGVLQWTFNGALTIPAWNFGTYYGGWVVEKTTGNIYLGQGFAPSGGHRVIRINTIGVYDNFITTPNPSFLENWKMYWNCNNGSPQLFIAGGGTNSNINFGIVSPPSTIISSLNVTGIPYSPGTGWAQDISDVIIDPATSDLYTIFGSLYGTPYLSNQIYKNTAPYSGASVAWNVSSGFVSIQEIANRPYLVGPEIDNSSNVLAINSSYLFYWDGKNLKAIDKASGTGVGTALTLAPNLKLMSGGIVADECNNIFVGSNNGTIKVYSFDGNTFNDAAVPDITVPGFGSSSVYDLAYYEAQKLLYASGNGFVASFDVSSYNCSPNYFTINVNSSCATLTATASLTPSPPTGSIITYVLYNGSTQIASNTTGIFPGLTPNVTYSVKAIVNQICSGSVTTTTFTLPGPTISTVLTNTSCGTSNGAISITAAGGTSPYTYSKDGVTFQAGNTFTGLASGLYTITVKDLNGCFNTALVNILNSDGPSISYTKTDAICGSNTGTVTANGSGGIAPLTYSINGTTFQTNNVFTGIVAGTYTLTVKDATGCTNVTKLDIKSASGPTVSAIPATTFCNTNNGSITAIATGGAAPLQYSINANTYQSSNIFTGLAAGAYTVTVKDNNGCLSTASTTVPNSTGPTVTATAVTASCANANGSITANGTGGVTPLQYSINGTSFQASNFFFGLTPGTYIVTVKDANNCSNTVSVSVGSTNGPQVTGTSTASACSGNTGSITASGSGGTGALQYSINGINYQAGTIFSGLAANTYTLFVKDINGCIGATIVVVPNSTAPTLTAAVTLTSCNANDGIITLNASGGLSPYQYSIDGITYQASNVFSGLAVGNYTLSVKDANNCVRTTSAVITNVAGLSMSVSVISSSCASNNGIITANASGGAGVLQYSINGSTYQSSNIFNSLAAGNYTVYVKDANGCIVTTNVVLNTLLEPQLSVTSVDANCTASNGSITATGSGGTPPLQYSINGVSYQSSGIFSNLPAGSYTVYLKDGANCIKTTPVTIISNGAGPGITSFTVRTKYYPCNGDATGSITNPRVNGANCGTCTFSLDGASFISNATQLYTGVAPGDHTITAKDANGCTKTITVTISQTTVSTATAVVTGTACNTSNGSIKITGIGPNTPYHASITGYFGTWVTFDPNYTFTGLAPGTYEIILADDASFDIGPPFTPGGCLDTITVVVPSIGGPTITSTIRNNGSCHLDDGMITVNASGGTGVLQYSINGWGFQTDSFFTNLSTGVYQIDVIDEDGCMNTRFDTITNPDGPSVSTVTTPTSCGNANGIITATGIDGTAPYQYSINGTVFQSSTVFSGLATGTYTVWVADASLCLSTTSATITATTKPAVTAYSIAASCNSSNGMVVANGTNGTSPYQFSIDGTTFQSSNTFTGLDAGFYTVTIKDAKGCLNSTGLSVGNIAAPSVTLASTAATCLNANGTITATGTGGIAPLQYSLNNDTSFQSGNVFTNLFAGSYTVYVKDNAGCQSAKNILITSPNVPQTLTATVTNSSCGNSNGSILAATTGGVAPLQYSINGSTYQASTTFSSLAAGTYPLTVKDFNSCTKSLNITILNLAGPAVTATSTLSSCFANDGTITAVGTGGTGALTYSKNGVTFQASPVFTNLSPGTYTIMVKDTKGCTSTVSNVIVNQVTSPDLIVIDSASVCGGNIVATASGGLTPYQYNINDSAYQSSNIFPCKAPGTYKITIRDANSCRDSALIIVDVPLPVELITFTGHGETGYNVLEWSSASELNNDYFILEKSPDGIHFDLLTMVDGAGSSNTLLHYTALDSTPFYHITYYRLIQVDFNSYRHYSNTIYLHNFSISGNTVHYNPIAKEISISFSGDPSLKQIELIDASGRKLAAVSSAEEHILINTGHLAKGIYVLRIHTEKNSRNVKIEIN